MSIKTPLLKGKKRDGDKGNKSTIFRGDISMISRRSAKTAAYETPDVWDPDDDNDTKLEKNPKK